MMESGLSLQELTASAKTNERDIRFAMRLSMIDPAIVESVLSGKSPEFLTYAFMKNTPYRCSGLTSVSSMVLKKGNNNEQYQSICPPPF